jgi:hypothetical protein
MTFKDVLAQVIDWLQQDKRITYRALKRQFDLDDEYLEDLKAELIQAKKLAVNWLRVLDTAESSQVDQRVCQQLHPIVALLDALKPHQQSLEFVLPRKGAFDTHA